MDYMHSSEINVFWGNIEKKETTLHKIYLLVVLKSKWSETEEFVMGLRNLPW